MESFTLEDGLPRWRWAIGDVVVERALAMTHGRSAVGVIHRVVQAPAAVHLELHALCTWRDAHGERFADAAAAVATTATGFDFEGAYRVSGVGFEPGGEGYRDVRYPVEAERGLADPVDPWHGGAFAAHLR